MPVDEIKYVDDQNAIGLWRMPRDCSVQIEELDSWGLEYLSDPYEWPRVFVPLGYEINPRIINKFNRLVKQWKDETWFISSIKKRISHSAYLSIIGMGWTVVPLIIEELRKERDYWHYALEAITGEDPAEKAESIPEISESWLSWGTERGY